VAGRPTKPASRPCSRPSPRPAPIQKPVRGVRPLHDSPRRCAGIARKFVEPRPGPAAGAWATWNAKGLVKPLLGTDYMRVADWLLAGQNRRHA
jgi:hypothetical protein